jgi:hypothetical protein
MATNRWRGGLPRIHPPSRRRNPLASAARNHHPHAVARSNGANVLRDAANLYKVDTEAIGQKVKQEFAAKDRVRKEVKPVPKSKKAA